MRWVKEGKPDLVRDYSTQDVKVTLDVFNYALEKKHLHYSDKQGKKLTVKLDWDLERFFKGKKNAL